MANVKSIAVIGSGTMGSGIALTAAQSGLHAFQIDVSREQLDKAKSYHAKTLSRSVEKQRMTALGERRWAAFDELFQIAQNFDLILDVNAPDARITPLVETARYFGSILRQQQPVGGMSGQVNKTLVQQFRMPGYPFVLVSTDLLQEGEDLHTFCSAVLHYGIAWTPSSMEQRIGRIDRVRSQSERRLSGTAVLPEGADRLQVYYPHLEDTVEVLQVQRVLRRMDTFLRLMHEGLSVPKGDHRRVDVSREMIDASLNSIGATTSSGRLPQWEPPSASS